MAADPDVPEERADEAFQHALSRRGMVLGASAEEARVYALTICAEIDGGRPLPGVVEDVGIGTGLDPEPVGYLIGAAVACYCPHNLAALGAHPASGGDPRTGNGRRRAVRATRHGQVPDTGAVHSARRQEKLTVPGGNG